MSDVVKLVQNLEAKQLRKIPHPEFKVGDTVKVMVLIKEGEKERAHTNPIRSQLEGRFSAKYHAWQSSC